ncbi:hypothetical protein HRbin01_01492 [archaeon HR01]|nr:hypothetical protein HRbin01_01492 [archaeon HR01]
MASCPECRSRLVYDRETKTYVCEGCGGTYTQQDLLMEREKALAKKFDEDRKRRARSEYLEWWLSSKETR